MRFMDESLCLESRPEGCPERECELDHVAADVTTITALDLTILSEFFFNVLALASLVHVVLLIKDNSIQRQVSDGLASPERRI